MNSSASIERLAELAPVRDEDLAAATTTPGARLLLAQILASPVAAREVAPTARRGSVGALSRRRWLAAPAFAIAVGAVALALLSSGGNGVQSAAAATLRKAARVARLQTPLIPGRGQYLYTKSIDGGINTTVPVGGAGAAYNVYIPHVRQIWLGPDGGRLYETNGTPEFPTAQDRAGWIADGRPQLTEPPSENKLPPARPLDLPSDPDALYVRLKHDAIGHGSGLYSEMFTLVGDSLRETSATATQRAALYQVAARLPGIEFVGSVKDSVGRTGVAVAMSDDGIRHMLTFDPDTSALLSEETVALAGNPYRYPPGARVAYATYLTQRIVDSDHAAS